MAPTTESIVAALDAADPRDRREACHLAGVRGDRRATPALLRLLALASAAEDADTATAICRALGRLKDGRALEQLMGLALGTMWVPRMFAVEALGRLGRKEAVPTLATALAVPDLRIVAARALTRLGSPGLASGRITSFGERGFGFVRDGAGKRYYFHGRDYDADGRPRPGQHVTFFPYASRGKLAAARVRPAPGARKVAAVKAEDGIPAQGSVRWFDAAKGKGFIRDDAVAEDVLVHSADIDAPPKERILRGKQRVTYSRVQMPKGWRAAAVKPAP